MRTSHKHPKNSFKEELDNLLIHPLINLANSERINRELESDAHFAAKMKAKIDFAFETFQKYLAKGATLLKDLQIWPQKRVEERFSHLLTHRQETEEELKKGTPLQQLLQITDEELLRFYKEAIEQDKKHHLDEAENILLLLTYLNPLISSFWVALGIVQEKKQDFEAAVHSHMLGAELGEDHFTSYLHAAQCLLHLHHNDKARLLLEHAKERAKENEQFQKFVPQIAALLKQAQK